MANFSKSDLISAVASATGQKKGQVEEVISAAFSIIREEAEGGKTVAIHGFGRFSIKERAARLGRNPGTGEPIEIAASRTLSFKPAKSST
ncbi:DNA-binding protein HU [Paracoccus kondratievae]|uniref:HU family DNA-binding protein n=1 Tax=Paracoccus kondratievae TaxID=135740 RepID=UPI0012663FCD|nr:HU family DNA-binding protein [Paracoccus kondratievae]QFQ88246.1 DNA-binding protein HU [Paracoccus kondratievae]